MSTDELAKMVFEAYEACKSENMCCPWCAGRLHPYDKSWHDPWCRLRVFGPKHIPGWVDPPIPKEYESEKSEGTP